MSLAAFVEKMTAEHVLLSIQDIVEDVATKPGQKRPQVVSRAILRPIRTSDPIEAVHIVSRKLHDSLARAGERTCIDWFGHQTWSRTATGENVLLMIFAAWYAERTQSARDKLQIMMTPQMVADRALHEHRAGMPED